MAARCGASIPEWLSALYDGFDNDLESRKLVASAVLVEQVRLLRAEGFDQFHFYTLNQAELDFRRLQHARHQAGTNAAGDRFMIGNRRKRLEWLNRTARERILVLDGAWGVMIQNYRLSEADFRATRFKDHRARSEGQQRSSGPDPAGDHTRDRPRLSRSRRRHHRDQQLQLHHDQPGRLRAGVRGHRAERDRGAACARGVRPDLDRCASALRRGRARPDQPHRVAVARRERSRLPQCELR